MSANGHYTRLPLSQLIEQRILMFCGDGKTGTIQLEVKDGKIVGCKLTESLHVK